MKATEPEQYLVYKISNKINDKIYFGITQQSIEKRWQQHKCNATRKNYHLYNAIKKYGFENFKIDVVFEANNKKEMFDKEMELIYLHKSNNTFWGYNNSAGGESSRFGCKLTKEQRDRISEFQKNKKRKPHSIEAREKMSNSARGRKMLELIKKAVQKTKGHPAHNRVRVVLNDSIIFNSITDASLKTGVGITSIHNNLNGRSKKTKCGIWKLYGQEI